MAAALEGCEAAYYLVHSLDSADFADRDRRGAELFGAAAAAAGLRQVVYLGGLGDEDERLSAHLASPREVQRILAAAGADDGAARRDRHRRRGGLLGDPSSAGVSPAGDGNAPAGADRYPAGRDRRRGGFLVGVLGQEGARGQVFEVEGWTP